MGKVFLPNSCVLIPHQYGTTVSIRTKLLILFYSRIGLVESKIRILILNLESTPFVSLAHVKPQSFPPLEPDK